MKSGLTELILQRSLYRVWGMGRELAIGNIYLWMGNESDFVTVTKAGYTDEYEIKLSRADFRADRKKDRHERYQVVTPWRRWTHPHYKDHTMVRLSKVENLYPNRFWYVVPVGLVTPDEVPEYAGLIYATETDMFGSVSLDIVKKAPQLHKKKIGEIRTNKILKAAYFRFTERWYREGYEQNERVQITQDS